LNGHRDPDGHNDRKHNDASPKKDSIIDLILRLLGISELKLGRNMILASVLLVLILITVVIFGVQSCQRGNKSKADYLGDSSDTVVLSTTAPDEDKENVPTSSVYAQYTGETETLAIASGYGILIDLDTNTVIASKDGDKRIYPASMTKVMTLIVAYENIEDLDNTTYTFGFDLLNELYIQGASCAGFVVDETVTARDLLYGAILPSGGDATGALAELVAGGEEHFAVLMNEKVKELGLENTNFVTASGLHDNNHYSTCHDIAKILQYAISNPEMRKILSSYSYTTTPTAQHPEGIRLTSTTYSRIDGDSVDGLYIQGGKTGYTNEARNCLCTFAANCRSDESLSVDPQYILVTAYGGSSAPTSDAIAVYSKYCSD